MLIAYFPNSLSLFTFTIVYFYNCFSLFTLTIVYFSNCLVRVVYYYKSFSLFNFTFVTFPNCLVLQSFTFPNCFTFLNSFSLWTYTIVYFYNFLLLQFFSFVYIYNCSFYNCLLSPIVWLWAVCNVGDTLGGSWAALGVEPGFAANLRIWATHWTIHWTPFGAKVAKFVG